MRDLGWTEPWLFQDVIFPLFSDHRASIDDACEIWIEELAGLLEQDRNRPRLFDRTREGRTTNIAAFLLAYSSPERRRASLDLMKPILRRQQQIVQQPLASTSDWTRWDDALVVSMWLLIFSKWGQYYLHARELKDRGLDDLSRVASELANRRSRNEWLSKRSGSDQGVFVDVLEEVEKRLASSDV